MVLDKLFNDIVAHLMNFPRALLLAVLLISAYFFLCDNRGRILSRFKALLQHRLEVLFFIYLSFLMVDTVFARSITNPFKSILKDFGFFNIYYGINVEMIENIMLFIPYTFLFCGAFELMVPWKMSLYVSLVTSILIELIQLFFWLGEFQLSDILHNTIGGIVGCALWQTYSICRRKHVIHMIWTKLGKVFGQLASKICKSRE